MKYTQSEYSPYMKEAGVRIEVYPNNEVAAKIVAAYEEMGFSTVPLYQLIAHGANNLLSPKKMISQLESYVSNCKKNIVFTGLDAYLLLQNNEDQNDFIIGLRGLVNKDKGTVRFLISSRFDLKEVFKNPRYKDSLQLVEFEGEEGYDENPVSIKLIRNDWCTSNRIPVSPEALESMGNYTPKDAFVFTMNPRDLPKADYGCVSVLSSPEQVMEEIYHMDIDCTQSVKELLLEECAKQSIDPRALLVSRLGSACLNVEKAPLQLNAMAEDPLWPAYTWLLKTQIHAESYLYRVLQHTKDASEFLQNYIVNDAIAVLGHPLAKDYAEERKSALNSPSRFEALIAEFALKTEDDDRALCFLNCGTDTERKAMIRHAKKLELTYGLPEEFDRVDPVIHFYLSPKFNYGDPVLTDYFHALRCFRMSDTVTADFVRMANKAAIPSCICKRDEVLPEYDDGETALLVVDGMGAEYYPLLMKLAKQNKMRTEMASIVSVRLPTSTKFNPIKWSKNCRLREAKRMDSVSHEGVSAHERCSYDENFAEVFAMFQKTVFPRLKEGLGKYKRVVVTADHGSSYLAVAAHNQNLDNDLPWTFGPVDDWRYAVLDHEIQTPEGMVSVYSPNDSKWYYVVKGYNRLKHPGGKLYALHGGASLEEMLVPLVVFTNAPVVEEEVSVVDEFIENDDFDIL